jgi:uncharacterized protein YdiU (UPF0061 family)
MRATISFETDVSKVEATMKALVRTETDAIRDIAHKIETSKEHTIERVLSDCLQDLYGITNQFEQYKSMLQSFGRAKYETENGQSTPEPANPSLDQAVPRLEKAQETLQTLQNMQKFDKFIESINQANDDAEKSEDE